MPEEELLLGAEVPVNEEEEEPVVEEPVEEPVAEVTPEAPIEPEGAQEPEQRRNLMDYSIEEIESMYANKTIDKNTFRDYIASKDIEQNGLRHISPYNAEWLYKTGRIDKQQLESYVSFQKHPVWWTMKDVSKGVYASLHGLVDDVWGVVKKNPFLHPAGAAAAITGVELPEPYPFSDDDLPLPDITPEGGWGQTAKVITDFGVPFSVAKKFLTAAKFGPKVLKALGPALQNSPKTRGFIEFTLSDTAAGAFADASFDPYEGRFADFANEYGKLPEFLDFMKTNPNNPEAVERLKTVLEGMALGVAFDAVFYGLKLLKNAVWTKGMWDSVRVQAEINQKFGMFMNERTKIGEAYTDSVYRVTPENKTAKVITEGEDVVDPDLQTLDETIKPTKKSTAEQFDAAFKTTDEILEGADPEVLTHKVAEGIEAAGGPGAYVEYIYKNFEKMMDKARGGKVGKGGVRRSRSESVAGGVRFTKGLMKEFTKGTGAVSYKNPAEMMINEMRKFRADTKDMDMVITAFNQGFSKYAQEIADMVKNLQDPTSPTSFVDKLKVVEHIKSLAEMQELVYGIRSDIGRTLGMYNEAWKMSRFDFALPESALTDIQKLREIEIDNLIKQFGKAPSDKVRMKIARYTGRNKYLQGLVEFAQANLLWNPATHIVNIIGNGSALAVEALVRHVAVTGNAILKGDLRKMAEIGHFYKGLGEGLKECFQIKGLGEWAKSPSLKSLSDLEFGKVWKALGTGEAQLDELVKIEGQTGSGIEAVLKSMPRLPALMLRPMAELVKLPFRSLTAGDELFKNLGYFSEVNSLIFREADKRVFTSTAKKKEWIKSMKGNIPADIHYEALNRARYLTFQSELGASTKPLAKALQTTPGAFVQLTAIPFFKIAVNLTKFSAGYTPLAFFGKRFKEAWKAGGIQRQEAVGRLVAGAAFGAFAWNLYDEGTITGHTPYGEWNAKEQAGWKPYAVKIGGKYYSMDRLEPFALLFKMAADAAYLADLSQYNESVPEHLSEEMGTAVMVSFSEAVLNATYLAGMEDLLSTLTQPEKRDLKKWAIRQSEKLIPLHTGIDWYRRATGKNIAELEEWRDLYMKKVKPDEAYHKRHTVYGTKIERTPDTLLIFKTGKPSDPVAVEMANLGMKAPKPSRKLGERKMTQEQWAEFNDFIAELPLKETLQTIIEDPGYQALGQPKKAEILSSMISKFHGVARKKMIAKYVDTYVEDKVRAAEDMVNPKSDVNAARRKLYKELNLFIPEEGVK